MRHVNPVRQSGPLPSYYGTYTIEDIKKLTDQFTVAKDAHYCQMDVDEVMRRVPGVNITLKIDNKKISWVYCQDGIIPYGTS